MSMVCQWCNEDYEGRKGSRYCETEHQKSCDHCGTLFTIKEMKRPAKTCSRACADEMTSKNKPQIEKICAFCGDLFIASKSTDRFCNNTHYKKCVVCDGSFTPSRIGVSHEAKTCSKKCAAEITDFALRNQKAVATNLQKYGVENASQIQSVKDRKRATSMKNHGVENIFQHPDVRALATKNNGKTISANNLNWQKRIYDHTGVKFALEVPFGEDCHADLGYENVLIDLNPTVTHSSSVSFPHLTGRCTTKDCVKTGHLPKQEKYHQNRALAAEQDGKILLQYFDWYNMDIFMSILKSKLKMNAHQVYARKTTLREITQKEANSFFRKNHLLGATNGQTVCLGLFYNDKLIHCQTYGKARFNKNFEWEAIRSCSEVDYQVQGGFSKCDKYFFNKIEPKSVISYVDLSISHGETENKFDNWKLYKTNNPNGVWVRNTNNKNHPEIIKDSTARRVSADKLLGFEIGDKYPVLDENGLKISNDFVLKSEGYLKVYDCGVRVFSWVKP